MEDANNTPSISSLAPKHSEPPWKLTIRLKRFVRFLTTLNFLKRVSVNFEKLFYTVFKLLALAGVFKFASYFISSIAQRIFDDSKLAIKSIYISNCKEDSATMHVNMVLKNTGPVPVTVLFTKPLRLGFVYNSFKSSYRHRQNSNSSFSYEKPICVSKTSKEKHLNGEIVYFGHAEMPNLKLYPSVSNYVGLELKVHFDDTEEFASFASQLIASEAMVLQLTGFVSILAFGFFPIHNLKLDKSCSVKGMKGLKELQINKVVVCDGEEEYLLLNIDCSMLNPADIDVDLGDVNFNMYYKGFHAGTVTIPDFKMENGDNQLSALGFIQPNSRSESAIEACHELLDRYVAGKECNIIIKGSHARCHAISYWSTALSVVNISTNIKGIQESMIVKASLVLSPVQLIGKVMSSSAPTILSLFNPFDALISVYEMQATATMRGAKIGRLIDRCYAKPIILKPHQVTLTPQVDLSLEVGRASLASLFSSVANQELYFDCEAKIIARVGKYPVTLTYSQKRVSLVLGA